jgi:hypothetical protein
MARRNRLTRIGSPRNSKRFSTAYMSPMRPRIWRGGQSAEQRFSVLMRLLRRLLGGRSALSILTTSTIFGRFLTPGEETDSSKAATHEDRIVKIAIVGASVRAGSPIAAELARPRRRGLAYWGHRAGAANGG